jgi:hypothetical protein
VAGALLGAFLVTWFLSLLAPYVPWPEWQLQLLGAIVGAGVGGTFGRLSCRSPGTASGNAEPPQDGFAAEPGAAADRPRD